MLSFMILIHVCTLPIIIIVSRVAKRPWPLDHNLLHLLDKSSFFIDPLKFGPWALIRDTTVILYLHISSPKYFSVWATLSTERLHVLDHCYEEHVTG